MRTRCAPVGALIGLLSSAAVSQAAPPSQAATRRIGFVLSATTWRNAAPLDVASLLRQKLSRVGIALVAPPPGDADVLLKVDFAETKGGEYRGLGEIVFGTHMRCAVKLTDLRTGNPLLETEISGGSGTFVRGDLYEDAVSNFKETGAFKSLEHLICAALGDRSCLSQIVPLLPHKETADLAMNLLDRAGFTPTTERENILIAIGRRDFEACVPIGGPAVEPLLQVLEEQTSVDGKLYTKDAPAVVKVLGEIGGPMVERGLWRHVPSPDSYTPWADENEEASLCAVFEALARIGTRASLAKITPFVTARIPLFGKVAAYGTGQECRAGSSSACSERIRNAAKAAVSEIERRVK